MARSITLSFTLPIELSIQMNVYMETKNLNRSQLLKTAITTFLNSEKTKDLMPSLMKNIHQDVLEIKKIISKNE